MGQARTALALCVLSLLACGDDADDEAPTDGAADAGSDAGARPAPDATAGDDEPAPAECDVHDGERLKRAACAELVAHGYTEQLGLAEIADETESSGGVTTVTFDPDSGPICLEGDDFRLHYKDTGSDSLLIFLDGGGACWRSQCATTTRADDPPSVLSSGPLEARAGNVFADWNALFVPYCDGSIFLGDNDFVLPDGTRRYHHGFPNLSAALELARERFSGVERIVLAGSSAGGYGTLAATPLVRLLFPDVDLSVLDDSGPGVQNLDNTAATEERIEDWSYDSLVPESCGACDGGRGHLTALIGWSLAADPTLRVSLLSHYEDAVVGTLFNGLTGAEYRELLVEQTDIIKDDFPTRFARFFLDGIEHPMLPRYWTAELDGTALSDWVAAMVEDDKELWRDLLE